MDQIDNIIGDIWREAQQGLLDDPQTFTQQFSILNLIIFVDHLENEETNNFLQQNITELLLKLSKEEKYSVIDNLLLLKNPRDDVPLYVITPLGVTQTKHNKSLYNIIYAHQISEETLPLRLRELLGAFKFYYKHDLNRDILKKLLRISVIFIQDLGPRVGAQRFIKRVFWEFAESDNFDLLYILLPLMKTFDFIDEEGETPRSYAFRMSTSSPHFEWGEIYDYIKKRERTQRDLVGILR